MAVDNRLSPAALAQMKQDFLDLQEGINTLSFPEDLLRGLDKFNTLLESSGAKLTTMASRIEANKEEELRLNAAIEAGMPAGKAREEAHDRIGAIMEENKQLTADLTTNITLMGETLDNQSDQLDKAGSASKKMKQALEKLTEAQSNANKGTDPALVAQRNKLIAEANELWEKSQEELKKYTGNVKEGEAEMTRFLNTTLGVSGGLNKLGGFLKRGKAGFEGMAAGLKKSIKNKEIFLNVGLKLIDVSIKMLKHQLDWALKQDKVIAEFRKSTGAGNEFNQMMLDSEVRLRQSGVELEEVAAAYRTLKNEVVGFTDLSKAQMESLADTTALLAEMGFELSTQASITQTAMESMNMSVTESEQLLVDLASTARTIGMDVDKLGQQFAAASDYLSGFGKEGTKVFEDMTIQAKSLGMEVSQLIDVMKKFETFDDAARSVGRLNAILGGPFLNSIDMMNAAFEDPAEGIKMLRASLDQAGVAMEDLSKPEKMAFASALGMSVEDMTNMMGKSNEELEIHRLEQEELAEQARQTMDITQQLKKAFQAFYISLKPFLDDVIIPLVGKMQALGEAMGAFFATEAGMISFFAIFGGLLVSGIALVTAFALVNMAAATASIVGSPAAAAASVLLGMAAVAGGVAVAGIIGTAVGASSMTSPGSAPDSTTTQKGASAGYASGGSVVHGFADSPIGATDMSGFKSTPIEINEFDSERLIVPYGTYVSNAHEVKQSNKLSSEIITELKGLRADLVKATSQPAQLVVNDDTFASTLINSSGIGVS